jgi:hypothetical protein
MVGLGSRSSRAFPAGVRSRTLSGRLPLGERDRPVEPAPAIAFVAERSRAATATATGRSFVAIPLASRRPGRRRMRSCEAMRRLPVGRTETRAERRSWGVRASASGRAGDRGRRRRARLVPRARAPGSSAAFAPIRSRAQARPTTTGVRPRSLPSVASAQARPTTTPSECSRHLLVALGRSIGMREGVLARRLAASFRRPALTSASRWGG